MENLLTPEVIIDESWFSDAVLCKESKLWYKLSKTLAEEAAWKFSKENGIDMVMINPGWVLGPLLQPTLNLSVEEILKLLNGVQTFPKTTSYTWVDARDVANAHIQAFELPEASGRYCLVGTVSHRSETLNILHKLCPAIHIPEKSEMNPLVFHTWQMGRWPDLCSNLPGIPGESKKFGHSLHSSGGEHKGYCGKLEGEELHQLLNHCVYWLAMEINHRTIMDSCFGFCGGGGSMRNRRVLYDDEGKGVAGGMEDEDESMEVEVADSDSDVNEEEDDEEVLSLWRSSLYRVQLAFRTDTFGKEFCSREDDYVLLEDNNVLGIRRPKAGTKKFKRLKKAGKDTDLRVHSDFFDENGLLLDDIDDDEAKSKYDDEDVIGDDEMDGFIVDAEETDGRPVRKLKRKSRQEYGVSSSTVEEAHDIFGDPNEYLNRRKKSLARIDQFDNSGRQMEGSLKNVYEPFILTEKYLTEKDDLIRNIDMPERIQISEESTGPAPVDIMSIKEETSWILSQLTTKITWFCKMKVIEGNDEGPDLFKKVEQDIERFLKLHHVEKHDIPFIAMYRKELCLSLLKDPEQDVAENEDEDETKRMTRLKRNKVVIFLSFTSSRLFRTMDEILWVIKDLDRKWLLLRKRKNALQLYYNKCYEEELLKMHDEARLNLNKELFKSISNSLKNAESEIEFKRPKRKSHYKVCSNAGLWEVAAKFGCNSEQFGLQVTLVNVRREDLEDLKESPEEIASTFTGPLFETPQAVLKGARHMAAVEISSEPCFRKHVQSIFMEEAVVSTRPTPKGNMVIDPSHEFSGFKWLHGKPLSQFKDAQWLLIQRAEEEKLLEVTIKLPESTLTS
ncbi:Transcription elongation factor SPT6-like [Vitis vinifera]|uniref:Transcription elongation factor SPT6-like n=1 Tax=Vitis vinifera TaxID=29760 RepID=A0A438GWG6_VITVI|nr:Transcription elongation factor SPT6-like [Vitis vinifera]